MIDFENPKADGLNFVEVEDLKRIPYVEENTYLILRKEVEKEVCGAVALQNWCGVLAKNEGAKVNFARDIQYLYPRDGVYGVDRVKMFGWKQVFPDREAKPNRQGVARGAIWRKYFEDYVGLVR